MRQTTFIKPAEVKRQWYVVDGAGQTLGRLATQVAAVLHGKHKPTFTPNTRNQFVSCLYLYLF